MLVVAANTVTPLFAAALAAGAALIVGALNFLGQVRAIRGAREQHLTERFTHAVEQLGHNKPDVRVGGIYALEQIANFSPQERETIYEVLCSFVQVHAPWPPRGIPDQPPKTARGDELPDLRIWAPDVQAAMTVLGRREAKPTDQPLSLQHVDLRRATLRDVDLERANLRSGCLQRIVLERAHLEKAILLNTKLEGADLADAHLQETNLRGAHLQEADLRGANLTGADVAGTLFEGATGTPATTWPAEFDAEARGVAVAKDANG